MRVSVSYKTMMVDDDTVVYHRNSLEQIFGESSQSVAGRKSCGLTTLHSSLALRGTREYLNRMTL